MLAPLVLYLQYFIYNQKSLGIITHMTHRAYIITGPTASGKSDFAHRLALRINGAIINCDSVQIYRGIENISASPFAGHALSGELDGVPYYLFSVLPLSEQISVSDYLVMARDAYNLAIKSGKVPIFIGGTGYYINALVNGISPMPDVSDENRVRARQMVQDDLESARRLLPADFPFADPQRIARAVEVYLQTGRHISEFQALPRTGAIIPHATRILINPDSDILRKRIASRVPQMLSGGARSEAELVIKSNWDESRAIGASQLCRFIRGEISESECLTCWITKTAQYAKRQRTWFRTQYRPDIIIDHVPTESDLNQII